MTLEEVLKVKKKSLGLALGAGSVRGLAHIGLLETLEEAGIQVDYIAGTSSGSLVGGLYAAGVNLEGLSRLICNLSWDHITDLAFPRMGFISGRRIEELLQILTKGKEIQDLMIPFTAVACDLERGEEILLTEGPLYAAIRASISIPGIYVPYSLNGRLLVDGGVLNRVPADVVRNMGAQVVIACDVSFNLEENRLKNILDVILQTIDIMESRIQENKILEADIVIRPAVQDISSTDLGAAEEVIEKGRLAAEKVLPEIQMMIRGER